MNTGIYCIKNKINNKLYIGSSAISLTGRKKNHWCKLKNNYHHCLHLQNAWNKYGEYNFQFIILEYVKPVECIEREQWYLNNYPNEYNICKIASSVLGIKRSKETKYKMSLSQMGNKNNLGQKRSEKTKQKLSLSQTGNKNSCFNDFIYTFKNRLTNEIFIGNQYDFYTKFYLHQGHVNGMILGKKEKSVKNWILINKN